MKRRILAVLLMAVMVMSLLAACSSDSSSDDSEGETETAEETSAAETEPADDANSGELTKLSVAFMSNYASLWTVTTAINKGYFEEEGLEIELYMFADGPTEIAAMESGSIDLAYIGPGAHKLCVQGEADVFCFSQLGNADCVMGLKSHGVESLEDLAGKTVAYSSGTSSETILVRALASVGLTLDDIDAVDMDVSYMVSAMISGSIDACAPWSPSSGTIGEELGDDVITFCTNITFSDIAADCASWICMPGYEEENRDTLIAFTRAIYKAMDFASQEENYEEVAGYVAAACGTDVESALTQTGDGAWLSSDELLAYLADGTIKKYYEVQQADFISSGSVEESDACDVEDYVLFDIMEAAGE